MFWYTSDLCASCNTLVPRRAKRRQRSGAVRRYRQQGGSTSTEVVLRQHLGRPRRDCASRPRRLQVTSSGSFEAELTSLVREYYFEFGLSLHAGAVWFELPPASLFLQNTPDTRRVPKHFTCPTGNCRFPFELDVLFQPCRSTIAFRETYGQNKLHFVASHF